MLVITFLVAPLLFAVQCLAAVSNEDTPCLSACGKWSDVVHACYQLHGTSPHTNGYTYSNSFLASLCTGYNLEGQPFGNETMNQVAGVCQSCSTTPMNIKSDLSTFLALCAIQKSNGTAANASTFAPLGYKTGSDANSGANAADSSSPMDALPSPAVVLGAFGVLVTSVLAAL